MARWMRCLAALVLCAMLSGCAGALLPGRNVEELLRAPQLSDTQSAVQTALNSYLGETLQLKYPRGGDEMAPMLFEDLDGDGAEEAAVLYITESKGKNVHLAVLEQKEENAWEVAYEIEGLSTEIAVVELIPFFDEGVQLVVGYANANLSDRYLAVYAYRDETVTVAYTQAYTAYLAADFTGRGGYDMAVVSSAQTGALSLQLVRPEGSAMTAVQTLQLDERFVTCEALYFTQYGFSRGLIMDGTFSAGGYASQVLRVSGGRFINWPVSEDADVPRDSLRFLQGLTCLDLTGYGAVAVPEMITGVATLQSARRFYYVQWNNYLADTVPMQFGIYDATYGYFVRLPDSWRDAVTIVDGSVAGDWQVRAREGNRLLLAVRTAERAGAMGSYTEVADLGDKTLLFYYGDACSAADKAVLSRGVKVFA